MDDELWRLEKIKKDGSFLKNLNDNGIFKVEDFLRFLVRDSQALKKILGDGMWAKNWDALVTHAKTCPLNGKQYVYYDADLDNFGIIFNNIHQVNGLIAGGQYYSAETLSDSQQVYVDTLVKKAYANWKDIVEYNDRMPLNIKQNKIACTSQTKVATGGLADYPVSFYQLAVSLPPLPPSIPSEQAFANSRLAVGDYPVSFEEQISVQCQPPSVSSQQAFVYPEPTVEDYPLVSYQQVSVPHLPSSVSLQAIGDYPVSFHPQVSFQPSSVQTFVNSTLAVGNYPISFDRQVSAPRQPFLVPSEQFLVNSESAVGECDGRMLLNMMQNETASSFQTGQRVCAYRTSFVPSEQASMNSGLVIRDDPLYSGEQVFAPHQPSLVPLVPANSEPAVGRGISLDDDEWWKNIFGVPPRKNVMPWRTIFCVQRLRRPVARKRARLVELGNKHTLLLSCAFG